MKTADLKTETDGSCTSESPVSSHQTTTYYILEDSNLYYHLRGKAFIHRDREMIYGNMCTAGCVCPAVYHEQICESRPTGRLNCSHRCSMVGSYECSDGTYCLLLQGTNPSTYKE